MEYPSSAAGETAAAKRAKNPWDSAAMGVDRLSALHDEILAKILSSVSSPDAVRTSVLAKRWRSVWKLLPDLHLPFLPEPAGSFRKAIEGDEVPLDGHRFPLRDLEVEGHGRGKGGRPRSLATWLPAAARRVTGSFTLRIKGAPTRIARADDEAATIELPCFERATSVSLALGFRGRLAFPPADDAGVFSRLTELLLEDVQFQDPASLGDAISSARCPCLQTFHLCRGRGLEKLAVRSTSLVKLEVQKVALRELTVEAPELEKLHVAACFTPSGSRQPPPPAVSITAPGLVELHWRDIITREAIGFGHQLTHLRSLGTFYFFVYGDDDADSSNRECLRILLGFRFIKALTLILVLLNEDNYLMEAISVLPDITTLHLIVMSDGHCFGDSSLHVLRICTGIRKLVLQLSTPEFEEPCPPGCFCRQRSNWRTEELVLGSLEEIEIQGLGESEHDMGFVEQLFGWAKSLTKATIFFHESVTEGVAKELCWMFQFFSTPKLHIDFFWYHNNEEVLYALEE